MWLKCIKEVVMVWIWCNFLVCCVNDFNKFFVNLYIKKFLLSFYFFEFIINLVIKIL